MHEASLARQVLAVVLASAARAGASSVRAVEGWVAETEALSPASLELHFAALARGTPAEGARLTMRLIHVRARCGSCGTSYEPHHHVLVCPACEATDAVLLDPVGLGVDRIEVATP